MPTTSTSSQAVSTRTPRTALCAAESWSDCITVTCPASGGSCSILVPGRPSVVASDSNSSRRSSVTVPSPVVIPAPVVSSSTLTSFSCASELALTNSCWIRGASSSRSTASVAGWRSAPAIGAAAGLRFGGRRSASAAPTSTFV